MGTRVTGHCPWRSTCDRRHGKQNTYPEHDAMAGSTHSRKHSGHGATPPSNSVPTPAPDPGTGRGVPGV